MLNSFKKELYFTVQYGPKLYSTVQYTNISVILSVEMSFLTSKTMETTYNMPMLNSFKKELYFTVQYGTKLYSTVQYINISVILSLEMSFLTSKTMEKTCSMPIVNSLVNNCTLQYSTAQNCTVLCST